MMTFAEPEFDTLSSIMESDDVLWVHIPISYLMNKENAALSSLSRNKRSEPKTQISGQGERVKFGNNVFVEGHTRVWQS